MSSSSRLQRRGEFKMGNWIGIIILVLIGAGVGGFFAVRALYRGQVLSPFQPSLGEYLAARPTGAPSEQKCKGGIMPIDVANNTIDHLYFDLPDSLRPADPAAVKTIVFLRWERQQTHQYGTKPGYTNICHVEVVDRETKSFLKQGIFTGPPPPQSISSRSSSGEGARPTDQVISFLQNHLAK